MAVKNTGAVKPAPLTKEQIEQIVADYISVHPKYFVYEGAQIKIDLYKMSMDGINWTGFNV